MPFTTFLIHSFFYLPGRKSKKSSATATVTSAIDDSALESVSRLFEETQPAHKEAPVPDKTVKAISKKPSNDLVETLLSNDNFVKGISNMMVMALPAHLREPPKQPQPVLPVIENDVPLINNPLGDGHVLNDDQVDHALSDHDVDMLSQPQGEDGNHWNLLDPNMLDTEVAEEEAQPSLSESDSKILKRRIGIAGSLLGFQPPLKKSKTSFTRPVQEVRGDLNSLPLTDGLRLSFGEIDKSRSRMHPSYPTLKRFSQYRVHGDTGGVDAQDHLFSALPVNQEIQEICDAKKVASVTIPISQYLLLEQQVMESGRLLAYSDHFTRATKDLVDKSLSLVEELDLEQVTANSLQSMKESLTSSLKNSGEFLDGMQGFLDDNYLSRAAAASFLQGARRDAYIQKFPGEVNPSVIRKLKSAPFGGSQLFPPEPLKEALEQMDKLKDQSQWAGLVAQQMRRGTGRGNSYAQRGSHQNQQNPRNQPMFNNKQGGSRGKGPARGQTGGRGRGRGRFSSATSNSKPGFVKPKQN